MGIWEKPPTLGRELSFILFCLPSNSNAVWYRHKLLTTDRRKTVVTQTNTSLVPLIMFLSLLSFPLCLHVFLDGEVIALPVTSS